MSKIIREIQPHWIAISPYLSIRNEEELSCFTRCFHLILSLYKIRTHHHNPWDRRLPSRHFETKLIVAAESFRATAPQKIRAFVSSW